MNESLLIGLIAAASGGAAAAIIAGLFQVPKNRAEAQKIVADTGKSLDERWRSWIAILEAEVTALRGELAEIKASGEQRDRDLRATLEALENERRTTKRALGWALALRDDLIRADLPVRPAPMELRAYIIGLVEGDDLTPADAAGPGESEDVQPDPP